MNDLKEDAAFLQKRMLKALGLTEEDMQTPYINAVRAEREYHDAKYVKYQEAFEKVVQAWWVKRQLTLQSSRDEVE